MTNPAVLVLQQKGDSVCTPKVVRSDPANCKLVGADGMRSTSVGVTNSAGHYAQVCYCICKPTNSNQPSLDGATACLKVLGALVTRTKLLIGCDHSCTQQELSEWEHSLRA